MLEREEVAEDERELEVVSAIATASAICVNTREWDTSFKLQIRDVWKKENKALSNRRKNCFELVIILQQKKASVSSLLPDLLKYSVVSGLLANLLIHS